MGEAWAIIKALYQLYCYIQYFIGVINKEQYETALKNIDANTAAAKTGTVDERLEAGKKVEDGFNKHI